MSISVSGMDNAGDCFELIPDQMPKIFEYIRYSNKYVEKDCRALASCNKRLSAGVVFNQYFNCEFLPRLQSGIYSKDPLYYIIQHRYRDELLDEKKHLWVARHYLRDLRKGYDSNDLAEDENPRKKTLFQMAVSLGDRGLAKVMLEHGADQYKRVPFCISGGPNCNFNAFHWEQKAVQKCSFDSLENVIYSEGNEPEGWLKSLCKQLQAEKEKIGSRSDN